MSVSFGYSHKSLLPLNLGAYGKEGRSPKGKLFVGTMW
jgi:hypothetical protein